MVHKHNFLLRITFILQIPSNFSYLIHYNNNIRSSGRGIHRHNRPGWSSSRADVNGINTFDYSSLKQPSATRMSQLPNGVSLEENKQDADEITEIDEQYYNSFINVARLYKSNSPLNILKKLKNAKILIIGIGGVGSWIAESLARSGIGNILLLDLDDICVSNINRQVHSTTSSVGQMKIDEMKRRLLDINPSCNVTLIHDFISSENAHSTVKSLHTQHNITACVDAIDQKFEKASLLASCANLSIPILTIGSSAGRTDPTLITVTDMTKCEYDRLLKQTRKILRQDYNFPKGAAQFKKKIRIKKWNIISVYSTQIIPKEEDDENDDTNTIVSSSFRRCDNGYYGTACFITGTFGFVAASCIVDRIVNDNLHPPFCPHDSQH